MGMPLTGWQFAHVGPEYVSVIGVFRLGWDVHVPVSVVVFVQLIRPSEDTTCVMNGPMCPDGNPWFARICSVANQSNAASADTGPAGITNVHCGWVLPAH